MMSEEIRADENKGVSPKKGRKPAKKFSAKKLPGIFKRSYTQKKLDRILRKIYVPADKERVASMFSERYVKGKRELVRVPRDGQFTRQEIKGLKLLAKDIKKNKGRVRLLPFIAVVCLIAGIGITVTVFKNPVVKWGIRSAMQGIFRAKCDIGSVNVEIFGARLTIRDLAQANADDPMRNIFQFEKLDLNFNLTQLLRARFNAENIEITEIALDTERKTSGALPVKPKSAEERAEKNDSTGFYDALKARTSASVDGVKSSIVDLLSQYDPQSILANIKDNIRTKQVAEDAEGEIRSIVGAWQARPGEIQADVENFRASTERLAKFDVKSLKTPDDIRSVISDIQAAIDNGKKVKENVSSVLRSFDEDKDKVLDMKDRLQEAIKSDKEMIKSQIPDLSVANAKNVLGGIFDDFAYSMLGKYYPYLRQAVSYAGTMKSSGSKSDTSKETVKKAKKQARKESRRYAGRNVYWRRDRVPGLLLERIHGSGEGIDVLVTNVSSDMDKVGEPLVAKGVYKASSRTHNAGLVIDARSGSNEPLISGSYSGDNFPLSVDFGKLDVRGVPSLKGTTSVSARLSADSDFSFAVSGTLAMNPVTISARPIVPEFADRIYSGALASVKSMRIDASAGFSESGGIDLSVSTDADKVIMDSLRTLAAKELDSVKEEAMAKISEELSAYTAKFESQFGSFEEIAARLKNSESMTEEINRQLAEKKEELTRQLTAAATNAVTEKASEVLGNSEAGKAAGTAVNGLLNKLKQ